MSLARKLAGLEALSLFALLSAAALGTLTPPRRMEEMGLVAARVGIVALVCFGSFYLNDLYNFEAPHDLPRLFVRLCRALGLAALLLALTYVLFPGTVLAGNLTAHAIIATLFAVLFVRVAVYALAKRAPFSQRVLILGAGPLAADLARQIRTRPDLALTLVGCLAEPDTATPARRLGDYGDIEEIVRRQRLDRIIVAMADRRGKLPVSALLGCRFRGLHVEDGSQAFERLTGRLAVESLTPSALIFGNGFRVSRARLAVKRTLSVLIALIGLVAAAPLMAVIAMLIKVTSPGPVFFVQSRVGFRGRPFRLVKFRTMRVLDPGGDDIWQRDNTSRITRVGAILRKYRLDELPQFINILRGDMSLVGPRPEMASNVDTFSAVIPFYNLRHEVRPGLTGWAQVMAGYSMTAEEVTRKLCYDLYYVKHMSLGFDLRILFETVKFVLSGKRPG